MIQAEIRAVLVKLSRVFVSSCLHLKGRTHAISFVCSQLALEQHAKAGRARRETASALLCCQGFVMRYFNCAQLLVSTVDVSYVVYQCPSDSHLPLRIKT